MSHKKARVNPTPCFVYTMNMSFLPAIKEMKTINNNVQIVFTSSECIVSVYDVYKKHLCQLHVGHVENTMRMEKKGPYVYNVTLSDLMDHLSLCESTQFVSKGASACMYAHNEEELRICAVVPNGSQFEKVYDEVMKATLHRDVVKMVNYEKIKMNESAKFVMDPGYFAKILDQTIIMGGPMVTLSIKKSKKKAVMTWYSLLESSSENTVDIEMPLESKEIIPSCNVKYICKTPLTIHLPLVMLKRVKLLISKGSTFEFVVHPRGLFGRIVYLLDQMHTDVFVSSMPLKNIHYRAIA